jgi:hypothetical protein
MLSVKWNYRNEAYNDMSLGFDQTMILSADE